MITAEQLKDVTERTQALQRYLNIDAKKIEFEEEIVLEYVKNFEKDETYVKYLKAIGK